MSISQCLKLSLVLYLQLKDAVASPGGTTISGIQVLERAGLRSALIDAFKVATDKSAELRPQSSGCTNSSTEDTQ